MIFFEILEPRDFSRVLGDHGARLKHLEEYEEKQNDKVDKLHEKLDGMRVEMFNGFNDLRGLIDKKIESERNKGSSNWKQAVTWLIAVFIGVPSCLWSFVQVVQFLSKR